MIRVVSDTYFHRGGSPFDLAVSRTSGRLFTSALAFSGPGILTGALLFTDGIADADITLYDSTDATGKIITEMFADAADRVTGVVGVHWKIDNGVYLAKTGVGSYAHLYFIPIVETLD